MSIDFKKNPPINLKSILWWRSLSHYTQQYLADKYHPSDDFHVTDEDMSRIKKIYQLEKLS